MPLWTQYSLQSRIVAILNVVSHDSSHHFGRPFMTPYQIAIEFEKQHSTDVVAMNKLIGGANTGVKSSLAQYIANQLSRRILSGELTNIEGRFLHQAHQCKLSYKDDGGNSVVSSVTGPNALSIFRLLDESK